MKYHIYTSNFDRSEHNFSIKEFYKRYGDDIANLDYYKNATGEEKIKRDDSLCHLINSEHSWVTTNKPCYKVSSETIEHFAKTPLNIPIKDFRMPYQSFLVRFPKNNGIEVLQDNEIKEVQTVLFFISQGYIGLVYNVGNVGNAKNGEWERPFTFFAKIQSKEQTIEQMFSNVSDGFIDDDTNTMITSETTIYLLSICVGVSIFATNTQFKAQYNSLEFLAEKCKGKKKKRLSKMANKSKHTGEIIFNYRDLNIFNEAVAAKIIGIGQELKYRHIRAAYTRTQRFGPGRKFVKTIDIKQTIVRPDLPVRI